MFAVGMKLMDVISISGGPRPSFFTVYGLYVH